jgi:membrane protein
VEFILKIKKRIKSVIENLKMQVERIGSKIILPGFQGYSLYDVGMFFFRGVKRGSITVRASSIAFNLFIAIFPGLIFLFSLIPYIPVENFQGELFYFLESIMPESAYNMLYETIMDTIMVQRSSTLGLGLILMLFFSSNGIISMIEAFNATYYNIDTRGFIGQRVISLFLMVILSLLLIIAISLMAVGNKIIINQLVGTPENISSIITLLVAFSRWMVIIGLFFLAISFLFYLAPSRRSRFKFITPGSIFSTFLIIISGLAFSYYINNFAMYNKLYGSIGTIIIVMLLFYFGAMALILGFELNVSILKKDQEKLL